LHKPSGRPAVSKLVGSNGINLEVHDDLAVYVDAYRRTGITGGLNCYRAHGDAAAPTREALAAWVCLRGVSSGCRLGSRRERHPGWIDDR
jgi:hypothetical protein